MGQPERAGSLTVKHERNSKEGERMNGRIRWLEYR